MQLFNNGNKSAKVRSVYANKTTKRSNANSIHAPKKIVRRIHGSALPKIVISHFKVSMLVGMTRRA